MDTSAVEYSLRKELIANYTAYSQLALLLYDILINLDREVQLVWANCKTFRWSNIIYLVNRYPVVAYQVWNVCFKFEPSFPHCNAVYRFVWYFFFIPTRIAIIASWVLRVYAVANHALFFSIILSLFGLATIVLDAAQGIESSCTHNTVSSETLWGVLTYISLSAFDVLATSLVTTRMIQAIRRSGRILDRQNLFEYILRSGMLYFGAVTVPQLIAVVLYFAPQGLYSSSVNNFLLVTSSIMTAHFFLGLREMNRIGSEQTRPTGQRTLSLAFHVPATRNSSSRIARWWNEERPRTRLVADFGNEMDSQ